MVQRTEFSLRGYLTAQWIQHSTHQVQVPGTVTYNSGNPGNDVGNTVAVQADRQDCGCGLSGNADVLLLRMRTGGTLDTTFSETGVQTFQRAADGVDAGREDCYSA